MKLPREAKLKACGGGKHANGLASRDFDNFLDRFCSENAECMTVYLR